MGPSVVSLAGELDLSTIPRLEGRLFEELRTRPGVVVDLTRLSFIDSSGIGLLIQAFRADGDRGGMCTVISPRSQVERVFALAGIDRALPVFQSREAALTALNNGSGT
ncbi:MAG: STAS domain-containing protein [Solirubrobacterales bacterium]